MVGAGLHVPDSRVDTVGMPVEGAEGGRAVGGLELDEVVARGGEEGDAVNKVVVGMVDLMGVLVEGRDGVGGGEGRPPFYFYFMI